MKDEMERFWEKVDRGSDDACWNWTASLQGRGYGKFTTNGKEKNAHRWIYIKINGPVADGIEICHTCDNPKCVNPRHLFAGTKSDNMRDAAQKGRNAMQRAPEKSHFHGRKDIQCRGEKQGNSRLTTPDVLEIIGMSENGISSTDIAKRFCISPGHARKVASGMAWSHVGGRNG